MKLRFSSLDDMFILHSGIADEKRQPTQFSIFEMFNPSSEGRILRAGGYNPEYYRYKMVVGYAPLPEDYGEGSTTSTDDLANFAEAVLNATTTYFLNYTGHEIDFKNDGSCEVTIDYIAAAEGSLDVPEADALLAGLEGTDHSLSFRGSAYDNAGQNLQDIGIEMDGRGVNMRGPSESLEARMQADRELEERLDDELETARETDACTGDADEDGDGGAAEDVADDQEEQREYLAIRNMYNRNQIYSNMMEQLYSRNGIFSIELRNEQIEELGAAIGSFDPWGPGGDVEWRNGQLTDRAAAEARMARGRDSNPSWAGQIVDRNDAAAVAGAASEFKENGGQQNLDRRLDAVGADIAEQDEGWWDGNDPNAEGTAEDRTEDVDRLRDRQSNSEGNLFERMFYFYYGDLLDVAMSVLRRDSAPRSLQELRPVVGPIRMSDPFTGEVKNYNLADIPISLELFNVWFLDKVVKPEREKYALKDFIKDTITTLIGPALSPRCFGQEMRGSRTRVSMTTVNAPFGDGPKDRLTGQSSDEPFGNALVHEILDFPTGENRSGLRSGDYFIIYAKLSGCKVIGRLVAQSRRSRKKRRGKWDSVD